MAGEAYAVRVRGFEIETLVIQRNFGVTREIAILRSRTRKPVVPAAKGRKGAHHNEFL